MSDQRAAARATAVRTKAPAATQAEPGKTTLNERSDGHRRRSEAIVSHFESLICRGVLKSDQCLPSERELALQFAVGRPTVREAIQQLAGLGLVEVRRAQGTYVRPLSPEILGGPLRRLAEDKTHDLLQIIDVRMGLEGWAAAEAARRATARQVKRIRAIVAQMERAASIGASLSELDLAFHRAVVDATDNQVLLRLVETLAAMIASVVLAKRRVTRQVPQEPVLATFREVADGIAARDPDRARRGMVAHLESVRLRLSSGDKA